MEENNFRNVVDYDSKSKGSFGKNILTPFISGVLGCTLVLGTCFGVPSIKEKIVGTVPVSEYLEYVAIQDTDFRKEKHPMVKKGSQT